MNMIGYEEIFIKLCLLTVYRLANLISHLLNMFNRKGQKAIFFTKIIGIESQ